MVQTYCLILSVSGFYHGHLKKTIIITKTMTIQPAAPQCCTELERIALVQEYLLCCGSVSATAFARTALYNWLRD